MLQVLFSKMLIYGGFHVDCTGRGTGAVSPRAGKPVKL
jgi:hypothetical protein